MMPNANIAQCVIQDIKFTQGLNLFYSWRNKYTHAALSCCKIGVTFHNLAPCTLYIGPRVEKCSIHLHQMKMTQSFFLPASSSASWLRYLTNFSQISHRNPTEIQGFILVSFSNISRKFVRVQIPFSDTDKVDFLVLRIMRSKC